MSTLRKWTEDEEKVVISKIIEKLQEALLKVIKSISKEDVLQDILICIMEGQGEYKCLGSCEQCGDTINEFTLNID